MASGELKKVAADEKLHALMRVRDPRFVELLYDRYADALYGIAIRIVKDDSSAKDVIQDSFVKVWRKSSDYDPGKAKLFTWLYGIVRNTAIDKLRSLQIRQDREIQIENSNVSSLGQQVLSQDSIDVFDHLAKLEPKYREVIELLFYQGYTQKEASEHLAIPLGTIKSRVRIALREMRRIYIDK